MMNSYNPDVLSCLANLSNDEVFTPPEVANAMLDLLPQELFSDPNTTFLDPACKSGVFLREIAKRLLNGLLPGWKQRVETIDTKKSFGEPLTSEEEVFQEKLQSTLDHIFHKQLFGIAITELTSLLSRRSVYCSKYPNSKYSVSRFDDPSGNIRYKRIRHRWQNKKCVFCGASQGEYDRDPSLESHAYEFIHTTRPEEIFKMKFDVIIGNPPYQLNVGSGGKGSGTAIPIYNRFVEHAVKLNPRYLTMIMPARWYSGGRGLDSFRNTMLNDKRISALIDYSDSKECFPGVDIAGGVCIFLWEQNHTSSNCCRIVCNHNGEKNISYRALNEFPIFIRSNLAVSIIHKVIKSATNNTMDKYVRPVSLFGLNTNHKFSDSGEVRVRYSGGFGGCDLSEIRAGHDIINKYKVYISAASYDHAGQPDKDGKRRILSIVDVLKPNEICTSTYIVVSAFSTSEGANNMVSYLKTKFTRFLLSQVCISQHISRDTFRFVPMQDFSKPWTDEELYAKYGLTDEEIAFIESMIKPMELGGDGDE